MVYQKIIQSGQIIELYEYERTPHPPVSRKAATRVSRGRSGFRSPRNISSARQAFRRVVWANLVGDSLPAFLTLTIYSVLSFEASVRLFTAFLSRLRREFGSEFRCISVPEFQRRGAVHFHVLIWDLPHEVVAVERETRRIARLWLYGFCDITPTDGHPKIASYMAKYLSKSMSDIRLCGKKAYFATRNILRPMSYGSTSLPLEELIDQDLPIAQKYDCDTIFLGRMYYKRYQK